MSRHKTRNVRRLQWLRYQRHLTSMRGGLAFGCIVRPEYKHIYEAYWLRVGRKNPNY